MYSYLDIIADYLDSSSISTPVDFMRLYSPDDIGHITEAENYRPTVAISYSGGIAKVIFMLLGASDAIIDIDDVIVTGYLSSSDFAQPAFTVRLSRSQEKPYVFVSSVNVSLDAGSVVVMDVEFKDKLAGVTRKLKTVASAV